MSTIIRRMRITLAALATALALVTFYASEADACYVAFVHGRFAKQPTTTEAKAYWNPRPADTVFSFNYWAAEAHGCKTTLIRWDGTQHFATGAHTAATQLASFINTNGIGFGQLIIVGHSMGGLVSRYILNNPALVANGFLIVNATKYLITSQTPHMGAKPADGMAGESSLFANITSWYAMRRGLVARDAASDSLRRLELEYASAPGGWMNDALRFTRIYTIESHRVTGYDSATPAGPTTAPGHENTTNLGQVWGAVCYMPHLLNALTCSRTPGDGLVEQLSAAGLATRGGSWDGTRELVSGLPSHYSSNPLSPSCTPFFPGSPFEPCRIWNANAPMLGARTRWLRYGGDHAQGSYDRFSASILRYPSSSSTNYLASYIGDNGLALAP